jgi:hypothetical protein
LLSTPVVDLIEPTRCFLRLSDLELDPVERYGIYSILGYPQETAGIGNGRISPGAISYSTWSLRKPPEDHVPGVTLALDFDQNRIGIDGSLARMPHLKGMSGCGIWRLATERELLTPSKKPSIAKLIGIEHGFVRATILGTHVRAVIKLIRDAYPDLGRSIDLQW